MLWLYDEVIVPNIAPQPAPGGYSWLRVARTSQDASYSAQDPEPTDFDAAGSQVITSASGPLTQTLGICVTWTGLAQQPGKYWFMGGCAFDSGGNESWSAVYKVLTVTSTATWSQTTGGMIAAGSFAPGYAGMTPVYACRASYMNGVHPGFVSAGNCYITWGGREQVFSGFETLAVGP